jgi:hypothetical protein
MVESTKPNHYKFVTKDGKEFDLLDLLHSNPIVTELFLAFRYLRTKGDNEKKANDLDKALEVLDRYKKTLTQPNEERINFIEVRGALPELMQKVYYKMMQIEHCHQDYQRVEIVEQIEQLIKKEREEYGRT